MLWLTMGGADSRQAEILDFMGRPDAYTPPPATVERIETHASIVFLAGAFAYKVKRAVKYPFLDFSTLKKRHEACLNEIRVNFRTAPQLYLEVVPVTLGDSGTFRLGGGGGLTWPRCLAWRRLSPVSMIRPPGCLRRTKRCCRSRACSATTRKPLPLMRTLFRRGRRGGVPAQAATGSPRPRPRLRRGGGGGLCAR